MTPEQRAAKVVVEVREHGLFNHVTDETWMRYIESAIKSALDDALPDANDLDEVVHALGIEDSDTPPAEAVRELMSEAKAWKEACRKAGICMSCALGAPEPFGCVDCLNTGWNGGSPEPKGVDYTPSDELPREPGACKCGGAPINKDGLCATCVDEQRPEQWCAFRAAAWPLLWGIETTDPRAIDAGLDVIVAPCMPEHAARTIVEAWNAYTVTSQNGGSL